MYTYYRIFTYTQFGRCIAQLVTTRPVFASASKKPGTWIQNSQVPNVVSRLHLLKFDDKPAAQRQSRTKRAVFGSTSALLSHMVSSHVVHLFLMFLFKVDCRLFWWNSPEALIGWSRNFFGQEWPQLALQNLRRRRWWSVCGYKWLLNDSKCIKSSDKETQLFSFSTHLLPCCLTAWTTRWFSSPWLLWNLDTKSECVLLEAGAKDRIVQSIRMVFSEYGLWLRYGWIRLMFWW